MTLQYQILLLAVLTVIAPPGDASFAQQALQVRVKVGANTLDRKVSGRVLVFFSQRGRPPVFGPSWISPEPFYGVDVENIGAGDTILIDDSADGLPTPLSQLAPGDYQVQAILDHDFYFANHNNGEGNVFSEPERITIPKDDGVVEIELTQKVAVRPISETEWLKLITVKSELLEKFHGREVIEKALVVLPPSYHTNQKRRYPVYYVITGFGGTLFQLQNRWGGGQKNNDPEAAEFIRVYLTGQCKWGHHVYANSATNGPRGDALVSEMIPQIDQSFRTIAEPTARFVGGHSSGGWSSLWLQVNYPETFGGVWSTAPDPVDFRDWQGTNLYDENGSSVFVDEQGNRRPLARRGTTPIIWYDDFSKMDDVMGRGGQLRSFEAVFSPRGEDGKPLQCWDRKTGQVHKSVVEHWRQYDISLQLEKNWADLEPRLAGKLHVYMGDIDTFYLDGATRLLGERMKKLGSDAVVELFPGKDHSNLLTPQLRQRINREMTDAFRKHHPQLQKQK